MMSRRQTPTATALAAGVLALVAGCGGSSSNTPGTSGTAGTAARSGAVLQVEQGSLGAILVNDEGRTVYEFAKDPAGSARCTGVCATTWPPVPAPQPLPASLPGVTAALGTTTRDDGSTQLTVAGHPVYTFTGDSAAGQTNGQGLRLNGGLWFAVAPAGSPVTGSGSSSTPTGDSPGYGY